MSTPYEVYFSTAALNDLQIAVDWIKQDSVIAALEFSKSIRIKCLTGLSHTPNMGKHINSRKNDELRSLIVGNYLILYSLKKNTKTVSIIRLLHSARDIDDLIVDL